MSRPLAVVTGGSAGIGKVYCERLAARGYDLLVAGRDAARLEAIGAELERAHGAAVEAFPADLSVETEIDRFTYRLRQLPRLALLVNNAGFGTRGRLVDADPALQAAMVRLHVIAPMKATLAALPTLTANGAGAVVNVASVAAFVYSPGNVNYCATKAYLVVFSEGLATELAGTGVQVQALCPGFTHSEFHERMHADKRQVPSWLWLDAGRVVDESLAQLDRGGPVICIPSRRFRWIRRAIALTPRPVLGRLARLRRGRLAAQ